MKKYTIFLIAFLFVACSNDEETLPVIAAKYSNLHAPQNGGQGQPISGPFTKFSFESGEVTEGNDWDIAFRGTTSFSKWWYGSRSWRRACEIWRSCCC